MKNKIQILYRKYIPVAFREWVFASRSMLKLVKPVHQDLYNKILNYYGNKDLNTEEASALEFLKSRKTFEQYPGQFIDKYSPKNIDVFYDNKKSLKYVLHQGKKLYYPNDMTDRYVKSAYSGLLIEQDPASAHCYFDKGTKVEKGDIFIDVGAAEGIIALSVVEQASKLYLFECDPKWFESLKATFEPYKDKIVIINKFASNVDSENQARLDSTLADVMDNSQRQCICLKIDTEGAEKKILEGAKRIIDTENPKIFLCTYHKRDDEKEFKELLTNLGFITNFSNGYMIPVTLFSSDEEPPYFRRGVMRCKRKI